MGHPAGASELPDPQRQSLNPLQIAREAYEWHGAAQRVDELAAAIGRVVEIRPQVIVEIGCDRGGTLFCWRQICDAVFGITLPENTHASGGQEGYPLTTHGATVLRGDSHDPTSLAWLREQLAGRPVDVLHIDGDHSYQGVGTDYAMYSPLVRAGGLVLVHDVFNHWDARCQVHEWWAERFPDVETIRSRQSRPVGYGVIVMEEIK